MTQSSNTGGVLFLSVKKVFRKKSNSTMKFLLALGIVTTSTAQIDRTCVDSNLTRVINSGINPCLHTPVTDGNKVEGKF